MYTELLFKDAARAKLLSGSKAIRDRPVRPSNES